MGFFEKLKEGLKKTKESLFGGLGGLFSGKELNDDFYDELEETLILSDLGAKTAEDIVSGLRQKVKEQKLTTPEEARGALKARRGQPARPFDRSVGGFGDRRERRRKDDGDRKALAPAKGAGKEGNRRGGGYIPCGGNRSAERMDRARWG